jgi:hypothetical protein
MLEDTFYVSSEILTPPLDKEIPLHLEKSTLSSKSVACLLTLKRGSKG